MVLHQQAVVVVPPDSEHLPQALVDEEVLAPEAIAAAQLPEVVVARLPALPPRGDRVAGEDLDGAMQAILAVVEVNPLLRLHVHGHGAPQAGCEKDSIGIHLHAPVVDQVHLVGDKAIPQGHEDRQVEGRAELAALLALQIAVDRSGRQSVREGDRGVAVHGVALALEQAHLVSVLHNEELLLVALRDHEGEAEQGGARGAHAFVLRGGHLVQRPEHPLLVHALPVASAHVDHASVDVRLGRVDANTFPILQELGVEEEVPLLVPLLGVAPPHGQRGELCGPRLRLKAQTEVVAQLAAVAIESPGLRQVVIAALPHLDAASQVGLVRGRQAVATLALDDAVHDARLELVAVSGDHRLVFILLVILLVIILVLRLALLLFFLLVRVVLGRLVVLVVLVFVLPRRLLAAITLLGLLQLSLRLLRSRSLLQELSHLRRRAKPLLRPDARDHAVLVRPLEGAVLGNHLQEAHIGKAGNVALLAPRPSAAPGLELTMLVALFDRHDLRHCPEHGLGPEVGIDLELIARGRLGEVHLRSELLHVLALVLSLGLVLVLVVHGAGDVVVLLGLRRVPAGQLVAAKANGLVRGKLLVAS
mmetsp:Transcript_18337/g.52398  ORF Transcript_18337/g.52398 Transcript_18337/m.52398 type:complete len:590 (+) Transcript_18337:278-2047(+)